MLLSYLYYILPTALQTRTDNKPPFSRAVKIPRTEAGYHVTDGNIAAIGFDTTSVSIAFIAKGDETVSNFTFCDEKDYYRQVRAPIAVLLEKKSPGRMMVTAFGGIARKKFTFMRSSQYAEYTYFERIKMVMRKENVIIYNYT